MASNSLIEWTDVTDNIIVAENGGWWCRKCSDGCDNCFSEEINQSDFFKGNKQPYTGDAPQLFLRRDLIRGWKRQRKSRRHFVSSMTDIFGEWVPKEWCFEFLDGMAAAPRQTFQLLTKRARRMAEIVNEWLDLRGLERAPKHMQFGVSVENQHWADVRIPYLLQVRCWVRFLSCEPMIGAVNLVAITQTVAPGFFGDCLQWYHRGKCHEDEGIGFPTINWVICGGESGPKARPMHPQWAIGLQEQCQEAEVPFFFKQWGEWAPRSRGCGGGVDLASLDPSCLKWPCVRLGENGKDSHTDAADGEEIYMQRCGKKLAGRLLGYDNPREWSEFPEARI